MENQVHISVENGTKTVELLTGKALERQLPEKVIINGLINAPYEYLRKRHDVVEHKKAMLIVNKSDGVIELRIDESNPQGTKISGALKINPVFESFGINQDKERDTFELADFIKMNRSFFGDKAVAMKIVSDLKNFKAKVDKTIELSTNDRGNLRMLKDQAVQSNIPESFDLVMPIFKGQEVQKFRVEISIDALSFNCNLVSPDANDLIQEFKEKAIDEQVEKISTLVPDLAILEV